MVDVLHVPSLWHFISVPPVSSYPVSHVIVILLPYVVSVMFVTSGVPFATRSGEPQSVMENWSKRLLFGRSVNYLLGDSTCDFTEIQSSFLYSKWWVLHCNDNKIQKNIARKATIEVLMQTIAHRRQQLIASVSRTYTKGKQEI